jgi:hypothetical protein
MQTFLPYKSFEKTAKCLDYRRLGKQGVEASQILNTINNKQKGIISTTSGRKIGWLNHPAVLMWEGYEDALKEYYNIITIEWVNRGYVNNMTLFDLPEKIDYPRWLGSYNFHKSHKSNLLRKDFEYYKKFRWNVGPSLPYIWPI